MWLKISGFEMQQLRKKIYFPLNILFSPLYTYIQILIHGDISLKIYTIANIYRHIMYKEKVWFLESRRDGFFSCVPCLRDPWGGVHLQHPVWPPAVGHHLHGRGARRLQKCLSGNPGRVQAAEPLHTHVSHSHPGTLRLLPRKPAPSYTLLDPSANFTVRMAFNF